MTTKLERRIKIKYRVRNKISGTAERPRMSVFRSNKQIYVQIINDLPRSANWLPRRLLKLALPQSCSTVMATSIMAE